MESVSKQCVVQQAMQEGKEESFTHVQGSTTQTEAEEETNLSDTRVFDAGVNNIRVCAEQYHSVFHRLALFFSIFLIAYSYGLDGNIRGTYQSYATSSYSRHSLLSTVNCIKTVIAAAGQVCFARVADIFGRLSIIIIAVVFYVVGTIIECQATTVTKFAVGSCFYQLGLTGLILTLEVLAMDFSLLNWRLVASFVPALPFIINTWISGNVTSAVGANWKWGIGMWAFILPLSCIPLGCCLLHMKWLAHKNAKDKLMPVLKQHKEMSWKDYIIDVFFWRLDFVGLVLICVSFGCILVPLTLAGGLHEQWKKAHIIVPEVIGWVVCSPLFLLWEIKFARHPFISWRLLRDRGIFSALIIAFLIDFIWYMQGDYMYTVLIVAVRESVKSATRITSLYSFVSVIAGTLLGLVIVKVRRTKPFILFGISCWFISYGLLVHYRGSSGAHSGIIGSLCLLGFGAGFFTYTTQASLQASTDSHADMAVITSLYLATYNIGASVGAAVTGAIWTNVLPKQIQERLHSETLSAYAYGQPFEFIVQYTWETSQRQAVVHAYRYTQKILCIVGLVFCVPLMAAALLLRDKRLESVVAPEDFDEKAINEEEDSNANDNFVICKS
ncbi:hypothetical protein BZL39_I00120 [Zygosaccharomyces parabailii]|nr:hypothetical protein BZL39_I00120 [Zygosaccharomyces parabailii]